MIQTSFIYLKDKADFVQHLSETKDSAYILIDPSHITDATIIRRLMRRRSVCLFEGSDWDNLDMLAPYIVRMVDLSYEEREGIFAALSSGQAIFISSSKNIQELKRHLKKFITQSDEQGKITINKFYTAINFLFYLETEHRFLQIFENINHVLCRTFDEPYQYGKIELKVGNE